MTLVIEERVALETVFILERFLNIELRTLGALVDPLGYRGVAKEIQTPDGHLGQVFGGILRVRGRATSHTSFRHLATGRCRHCANLVRASRVRSWRWAAATAAATTVLSVVATGCR